MGERKNRSEVTAEKGRKGESVYAWKRRESFDRVQAKQNRGARLKI